MERVGRPSMSAAEKAEVWRRWKQGESVSDIGRALGSSVKLSPQVAE